MAFHAVALGKALSRLISNANWLLRAFVAALLTHRYLFPFFFAALTGEYFCTLVPLAVGITLLLSFLRQRRRSNIAALSTAPSREQRRPLGFFVPSSE
tara:strand:+ start:228 stop:521 length:294 start_codon:yes stop_codon:yes gene_type:complete